MKICIFGAGAVGGYLGVLLKEGGADVSLIARGAHLEAIKAHGLKLMIAGKERIAHMPATSNPAELGPQDYVIVALKSHQAWEVADRMEPLLGRDTAVVTAQNGIPWWYFYGFEGQFANLQLQSVDPDGRQWNALGPDTAVVHHPKRHSLVVFLRIRGPVREPAVPERRPRWPAAERLGARARPWVHGLSGPATASARVSRGGR